MIDQVDPATMAEMRAWAEAQGYRSLLGDEIVEPDDMTDEEVLDLMDRQFPGGSDGFAQGV